MSDGEAGIPSGDLKLAAWALLVNHDPATLLALTSMTGAVSTMAADATGQRSRRSALDRRGP